MNICVYGASSASIDKIFHDKSYDLGAKIAKRGHGLIFGGGANGVMGASARGAYDNGGAVIGVAPTFFQVDGVLFDKCTEFIDTTTMRERKQILEERSDAFIMAPGGLGTFDEFFEIVTLKQLQRHNKPIAVFNVNGYFDDLLSFLKKAAKNNFMREKSLELFKVFDDENELLDYVEKYDDAPADILEFKILN